MGKQNLAVNQLLERKEVFADLMNGIIFEGNQILKPENLEPLSNHTGIFREEGKQGVLERWGDVKMRAKLGTYHVIFAEETQNRVHYAMPVRVMLQEALEYTRQAQALEKKNKVRGKTLKGDAFLSGIEKAERLEPVITVILYLGNQWDGSKSLYEMLGIDEDDEGASFLEKYLQNYRINVIPAAEIEAPERFKSCLQYIFHMLKYNSDKQRLYQYVREHEKEMGKMDGVEIRAAMVMLGGQKKLEKLLKRKTGEEETVMWEALDELYEDGKQEGVTEGKRDAVLTLLEELDRVPERVKTRVRAERNTLLLGKWLKLAAKSESMDEFLKRWEEEEGL